MPGKGRAHFETYTEQNRVKHAILTKYLRAYLNALSNRVDAFYYIDGFAGAGTYAGGQPGSPLYALTLLAEQKRPAAACFVERDAKLYEQLSTALQRAPGRALWHGPVLYSGDFSDHVAEVLGHPIFAEFRRVATFAFVDPCGLKGLYLDDLARVLERPFAECLMFLNYDGLPRWIGGVRAKTHGRENLNRFFGSEEAGTTALACVDANQPARESRLLDTYVGAVRMHSGAEFVLPFRVRARDRDRTSHYLIHLSRDPLAFKIMKDVMHSESSPLEDFGSFGFIPSDDLQGQGTLFHPNMDLARAAVLDELQRGPRPAALFMDDWPSRPTDMLSPRQYKELLLALEADQRIVIRDATTGAVTPAAVRPKRKGQPTLGAHYELRLRR